MLQRIQIYAGAKSCKQMSEIMQFPVDSTKSDIIAKLIGTGYLQLNSAMIRQLLRAR
jgi:hypothetical protein